MGNDRKKQGQIGIADMLPHLVRERGWAVQLDLHTIFPHWREVVDETTAAHAKPLKIVRGTLWVEVENSAWLQQLQFQLHFILEDINRFLKKSRIQDIRLVLPEGREKKEPEEKPSVRFVAPPAAEIEAFEQQIGFIEDKASRDALMRFWYLARACQREKK